MAASLKVIRAGTKAARPGRSDEPSVRILALALVPGSDTWPRLNVIVFGVLIPKKRFAGKPSKGIGVQRSCPGYVSRQSLEPLAARTVQRGCTDLRLQARAEPGLGASRSPVPPSAAFDRTAIRTPYCSSVKSRRQSGGVYRHIRFWYLSKIVSLRPIWDPNPYCPAPGPRLRPHPVWSPYPNRLVLATLRKCRHAFSP